jgi:hypothetical protein
MNSRFPKKKKMLALLVGAGLVLLATVAIADPLVLDWRVNGTGLVGGTCEGTFGPNCTSTSTGSVLGTHIGSGTYMLSLTAGSFNTPMTTTTANNFSGGQCLPANGTGTVTSANGDTISFNTVGWLCEEGAPGSDYHYNATYRITAGSGRFSNAAGGGNVAATFEKGLSFNTYIKIDGTITF